MSIDWESGPKYSIGFAKGEFNGCHDIWYRKKSDGDLEYCWDENRGYWMDPYNVPENIIWRESETKAWTGEGLPPVGTVCEFEGFHAGEKVWKECRVIAHDSDQAIVNYMGNYFGLDQNEIRAIRTPEQIAEDERLHEIRNALTAIKAGQQQFPNDLVHGNIIAATVEAMIDAGYRKAKP